VATQARQQREPTQSQAGNSHGCKTTGRRHEPWRFQKEGYFKLEQGRYGSSVSQESRLFTASRLIARTKTGNGEDNPRIRKDN